MSIYRQSGNVENDRDLVSYNMGKEGLGLGNSYIVVGIRWYELRACAVGK
jgi:hypothetical protein